MFYNPFYKIQRTLRYKIVNFIFICFLCIISFVIGVFFGKYTNFDIKDINNIPIIQEVSSYEVNTYESEFKLMCDRANGLYNDYYGYCDLGEQIFFTKYLLIEYLDSKGL